MKLLRTAVIGAGALGRHHARILAGMSGVELVAVADTNAAAAAAVAAQHGTRPVADFRELLNEVDAAVIAVPTSAHRDVAREFLVRSIPVMVEKPLAASLDEATELVELADARGTLLQVGHVERFNPATRVAWQEAGPPKYVRAERLSNYSFRSTDIGVVHDLMIHDIDLLLDRVPAPVRDVEAFGIGLMGGHEDCVQARLRFENGCVADLTANRVSPVSKRGMQIWSLDGCVTVDFAARTVTCYSPGDALRYGTPPVERARRPGADVEALKRDVFGRFVNVRQPQVPHTDALTAELEDFVDAIHRARPPLVDGHHALAALRVADRILHAAATHQWDGRFRGVVGPALRLPGEVRKAG